MILSSWNVNSVRARIDNILGYLDSSRPDILMMQEIKTEEKNFPFNEFKNVGYNSFVSGQKSYNGVAFLSKKNIENINLKFFNDKLNQARIIVGDLKLKTKTIKLINIYVPNGNPIETDKYIYKKNWLELLIKQIEKTKKDYENIIIGGDFNIIPDEIDVYNHKIYLNDALFKLEIRKKLRELINLGFYDIYRYFNNDKQEYTFWDYQAGSWQKNNGMRIDHFLISNNLINNIKSVNINKKPRSILQDHIPIISFLKPGILKVYYSENQVENFFIEDGVIEFTENCLTVLTSNISDLKNLDKSKIAQMISNAEKELNDKNMDDNRKYLINQKLDTLKSLSLN